MSARSSVATALCLAAFSLSSMACTIPYGSGPSQLAVELVPGSDDPVVHVFTCPGHTKPIRSLRLSEGDEDNVVWEIESHSEAGVDVASAKIGEVPKGFERRSGEVRLTLKRDREYLVQVDVGAHDYGRFTLEDMAPGRMYWGRDSSGSPSEWRADRAKVC